MLSSLYVVLPARFQLDVRRSFDPSGQDPDHRERRRCRAPRTDPELHRVVHPGPVSHTDKYQNKVYTLPKELDEKVARLHLAKVGVVLEELTPEQANYISVPVEGPYKPHEYRY